MTRKRKALIISGTIISLLILGGYFFIQSNFILNKFRGILETRFTNQLKTEVKFGRLSGNLIYGLKIENVTIADKNAPEQSIISMDELLIKYKFLKLLSRTLAIKELTLQKPVIHAMVDEQGNINLSELISTTPESQEEEPFFFQVKELKLVDGHIYYKDKLRNIDANISGIHLSLSGPLSPWNHNGKLAFQNAIVEMNNIKKQLGTFDMDFHFTQEDGKLERLRLEMENSWLEAQADANFKSPTLQANINGEVDLKDIANFAPLVKRLEGIVYVNLSASGGWDTLTGNLELTSPAVLLNNLNFSDVSVDADFTNNSVKITQLSANIADGNIQAIAQARINNGQPDYDAQVSITSIQAQPLLSILGFAPFILDAKSELRPKRIGDDKPSNLPSITGEIQGKIKLSVTGFSSNEDIDWSSLNTEGQFELSDGTFNGIKLLPSIFNYTLKNEQLAVNANIDRIQADINGQLGLTDKINLKMNLNSIDLSQLAKFTLPTLQPPTPFGKGDEIAGMGELVAQITGELTKPEILANLTLQDIAMNGTRLGNATGQFLYSENQVQVDELQLRNADTQCVVNGIVTLSDNPTVDLNVTLNPLQISEYTTLVSAPLDLKGQVFGEITLRGPVTALNGGGELIAHDIFASRSGSRSNNPLAPFIKGECAKPDDSNLRQVFSIPIEMKAPLKLKNGIFQISDLTLKTTGGEFYISAVYNPNGEYEFQLNSGDLNLARILGEFGIKKMEGYGQLTANGKGMISKPQARVSIDLKSVQYADVKIGDIAYKGYFDNNKLQFNAAALSDSFKLEGEVNAIHPMLFNVTMQLEKLDFGVLLEALPSSMYSLAVTDTPGGRVSGETTGVFNINGEMANVVNSRGTIQLQSVALQTPRYRFFNSKPIKIAFANQTVDVKQFELLQQLALERSEGMEGNSSLQSILVMKGRVGPEKSDFTAQSDEFDLAILKDIIGGQKPKSYFSVADISGLGKFKLHLTGSYFNPEFVFDWEFPEISVATSVHAYNNPLTPVAEVAKLRSRSCQTVAEVAKLLDADISNELDVLKQNIPINSRGHLTYRDKLLTIDQIQLALYSNPIELKGVVPVDLTLFPLSKGGRGVVPVKSERSLQFIWQQRFSDSSMRIQLTSPNWDINFIDQFTPEIEKINGYANTNIEISGSPLNPKVSGNILLSDVFLKSPAIKQPLENLSAIINININSMNKANVPWLACTFDSLQWNIGQGRYSASGFVQYRQNTPPTKEMTSWFDADFLSAIKESIAQPEIELTFQGADMDLDAFVMDNGNDANAPGLPFDGRASMFATVKGKGMKLQDYTAQVEIEPLVLVVGDYGVQNDGKIKMTFQNGQIQLDSIILKSQTLESTAELSLSGSVDLNGRFNLKMFMRQFNLKILSPFLKNVPPIDGLASIQLDANGTFDEPEASVSFDIQNIHVQDISAVVEDISVDAIKGSILLKNGTLTVNQTSLQAYDNELTFHGKIPLNLTKSGENSEPMQIFIKGEQINLAQLATLNEMVQEISGKAHLDMVLCSEPSLLPQSEPTPFEAFMNPYLTGNLTMTDGRIKLANLNAPIESLKLDLVALQAEPDKIENEIRLNELSFQLSGGKYKIAAAIKMNGLMPQQYDGTMDIDRFQLELIDSLFLKETVLATETKNNLSGYLSVNAETKLNLGDLLNIPPTSPLPKDFPLPKGGRGVVRGLLQPEQKFWKLMGAAMGSKVTLPEIGIQIAGYPIYNQEPVTIFLNENMLSLPGCKLYYQNKSEDGFTSVNHAEDSIFLKAYGRWESNNQLAFEFMGFADTQMIAEFTQLSDFLSELATRDNVEPPISGLIEYRASVRGSASEPQIKVSWPAADIALLGADVELLDSEIFYKNGSFDIKEIKLVTERTDIENIANINSILVTGQVPFNLSFMPYVLSPSENELDLTISASIEKLDSLPLLAMQDATIDGNGEIKVKVGGTIQAPQFSDDVTLKNIIYQYENVNVTNTNVKLTLNNNNITIEQVRGDFNGGSYQCSGKVGLSEYKLTDLSISGNWRDVEWEQEGIISLICEGSVQLLGTFDKPRLVGNVIVKNGIFEQSWQSIVKGILSKQPEGREEVILDYPLVKDLELDLNVQIPQEPDHFWLDTIGTKIQPQVNGRVVGPINPITRLVFVGQVDILEGEFSYFNRKFLIKSGTVKNSSSYALDPRYEIDAEIATPIVGAKIPDAQEPKDVKITLNMTGSLLSPQAPVLEAEVIKPGPGEQYDFDSLEILELLTFGSIVRQEGDAVSFASETATYLIMRQAELFVGSQIANTFHLRELQLGISDKDGSLPQFLITKEISPQWAVTYMSTYSLSTNPSLLSIEYKLDDNVSIAGTRNEYGKYGVDLKYGIEW